MLDIPNVERWGTLYELSRLDPPQLEWAIERGELTALKLMKIYKALDIDAGEQRETHRGPDGPSRSADGPTETVTAIQLNN